MDAGDTWEADWGGASVYVPESTYEQPRTDATVTRDIVTQRQDIATADLGQWGGFFQKAIGSVLDYGIKKDAAQTGVQLAQAQQQQARAQRYPLGTQPGARGGITANQLLLIGGAVLVAMVLKK
jgi:hypothetical protein